MSWLLFSFGSLFALLSINSHRPLYRPAVAALATWIPGWLVTELPLHHIALQLATAAGLSLAGGAATGWGLVGLALTLFSVLLLWKHVATSTTTSLVVERAMKAGLGNDYHDRIHAPPEGQRGRNYDPSVRWTELARIAPKRPVEVEVIKDLVYCEEQDYTLTLDIYRQRDLPANAPVFLYFHGGGWTIGTKNLQGLPTIYRMAKRGWLVYTVNYRLSPTATFPDHLVDAKRAIAYARTTAAERGGDPKFIMVAGGSSGAHLATLAALTPNASRYQPGFRSVDTTVQGCVSYYGIYDLLDPEADTRHRGLGFLFEHFVVKKRRSKDPQAFIDASPVYQVPLAKELPPFFLVHGTTDNLAPVAGARKMRDALAKAGARDAVYVELSGAHHAFETFPSLRSTAVINGVDRYCHFIHSEWLQRRASTPRNFRPRESARKPANCPV